jgi:NADH-quinone oxidoreductase subunit K
LTMAAAEVSIGLSFILLFHKKQLALDVDEASELRG